MDERQKLLRAIPQVDELLREPLLQEAAERWGRAAVLGAVRAELDALRASVLRGDIRAETPRTVLAGAVQKRLEQNAVPHLRRVLNATGVALHTNLGRAPLAQEAVDAVYEAARGYCNLEYDLASGGRGSRGAHVEPLLCALCGCEDALVVNNNAAAVLLALSVLARNREIIVSRGELVEIGGSFRVPDIMEQSGGRLIEVGSTNKTRLKDYEAAICGETGLLLKVHTSNFRVIGFTESVSVAELTALGKAHSIPVLVDLGSGALTADGPFPEEPSIEQTLREGADLVCFSGDKLLGGPQAGILLGRRALIEQMRKSPLARALRIDKLSLAALEATLQLCQDPDRAQTHIPVLRMLCATDAQLRERAERLCALLPEAAKAECIAVKRPAGGGSAPGEELAGYAAALSGVRAEILEQRLRAAPVPVIARIAEGRLVLDVSTLEENDLPLLAQEVADSLREVAP